MVTCEKHYFCNTFAKLVFFHMKPVHCFTFG